ncbi:MAG: benzoate/H(+) symporter BenE family transporter [Burkholderiales bacterium]|nr:benzoate/H(+) symporter BenE family transporter [Burkholderiales bacterium]
MPLEPAARPPTTLSGAFADLNPTVAVNGLIGFVFAATGPVAVILSVGAQGGLSESQLASWIFGSFFLNGLITLLFCWRYRQPLAFFWTIPGAVLVGPALGHLSFSEVVGAFIATGALMLLLGFSGWVRRAMQVVPMPIVMGMVAGVFLRFGTDLIDSLHKDPGVAVPMVLVFIVLSALPSLGRRVPPMIGAMLVGILAIVLVGRFAPDMATTAVLARPELQSPQWSWPAMLELVVPLAITVLVVQNGQGVAVLKAAGHDAPVNAVTIACGLGSMLTAMVGTVSTCLTGPTNAILASSGPREQHYTGGLVVGLLALAFGLLSPLFTRLMLATPPAFIAALAGLAMLRVLQTSFVTAFAGRFTLGALITFLVTVSDKTILDIGAPFWGLLAGLAVSWLLERQDLRATMAQTK